MAFNRWHIFDKSQKKVLSGFKSVEEKFSPLVGASFCGHRKLEVLFTEEPNFVDSSMK